MRTWVAGPLAAALLLVSAPAALAGMRTGSNDTGYVDSLTGQQSTIRRIYEPDGTVAPVLKGQALETLRAGMDAVISFRPHVPAEPAQLGDFSSWCQSVVSDGYAKDVRVTVWHEANLHLSLSAWLAEYAAYEQVARRYGLRFGVIFGAWSFNHGGLDLNEWMPPADTVSFLAVDLYPRNKGAFESPMSQLAPELAWTAANRKPLDIAEVGVEASRYGTRSSDAGASRYLLDLEQLPARSHWVMWFQGDGIDLGAHDGALVPAWEQLTRSLDSR